MYSVLGSSIPVNLVGFKVFWKESLFFVSQNFVLATYLIISVIISRPYNT